MEGEPRDELDVTATLFRMLVPGSQIGCLLGKGGSIVNQLRDESGAGIRIVGGDQVPRCALPTDEMVQVGATQKPKDRRAKFAPLVLPKPRKTPLENHCRIPVSERPP